ncbi:MAG: cupin domain-containing protein [Fluviicola sp. XM-24bin1]|nr:MAG: cupin domain-containing protein [Fluviicola sp. XM-24bin1]
MKHLLSFFFVLFIFLSHSQEHKNLNDYQPTEEYENVHVLKIAEDDLQSTYIIWVKDSVPEHYHASHTENIVVIQGKARMTLNGEEIIVKKGDFINIPEGTKHAVLEVLSHKPLKVLSTQTPMFDGKDRIFTKPD